MALLDVEGLRGGYGSTEVLHGVDLHVPAGCTVLLLGANGAGKTTLLKMIAGSLSTNAGHIRLHDTPIERWKPHRRTRAGLCLIPEGRGIFRRLSVRDNLAMQVHGKGADAAMEVASAYFPVLGKRVDQLAGTMSGGEQQMLALARALVTNPELVMADELSLGLAPVIVDEILDALQRMRDEGRALLLVEQYVERALELADYVYILHKGEVVFVGEPAQCASGQVFHRYLGGAA
jgi:branched-chain amino acid transport system ATP-binding protein